MKKLRILLLDLFFIFILLLLSIFAWKQIPELVIRGDGFVYMVSTTLDEFFSREYWYTGFETSAAVLGTILPKLFKTNISLYFYISLAVMMIINVVFYILLRVITKHKIISFFGALLFAVNYFGNFDMYSQHCYCFFMERVVTAPFLLFSFLFLHKFLEKNRFAFYIISLVFYFIGLGIGHFALLFTPPYLIYPFFWKIFYGEKSNLRKNIIHGALIGLSFLAISVFIVLIQQIHEPGHRRSSMIEYFFNPQENRYPEKVIRQLVYWSQYEPLIKNMDGLYISLRHLSTKNAEESTLNVLVVYILVGIVIYKKLPDKRALLFTTIFGTGTIFYLNAWFGQYDILYQADSNRYLYFPTFLLAMFWMLFLWVLWRMHIFMKLVVFLVVVSYFLINWLIISDMFRDILSWDRSTKVIYQYMTSIRDRLPKGTLVVAPYPELGEYESRFFTEQLGNNEIVFLGEENPYRDWKKIATLSAQVIRLHYDKMCDCVKEEKIK